MGKIVYLRNGNEVLLHETLANNKFVIERLCVYFDIDEDGENQYTERCGVQEVVDQVFTKPPIEKKQDYFIEIAQKTESKKIELAEVEKKIKTAEYELRKLKETKTEISKFIINRSEIVNAKSITVFGGYKAYTIENPNKSKNLRLTYRIDLFEGEIDSWICNLDYEGCPGVSTEVNKKYGLMIDATKEQIIETGKQIVREKKEISNWDLERIPDEYLTADLLAKKEQNFKANKMRRIQELETRVKESLDKINELKAK